MGWQIFSIERTCVRKKFYLFKIYNDWMAAIWSCAVCYGWSFYIYGTDSLVVGEPWKSRQGIQPSQDIQRSLIQDQFVL